MIVVAVLVLVVVFGCGVGWAQRTKILDNRTIYPWMNVIVSLGWAERTKTLDEISVDERNSFPGQAMPQNVCTSK